MKYLSLILITLLLVGCSSEVENEFEDEDEENDDNTQTDTQNQQEDTQNDNQQNSGISLSELQSHDNKDDCWVAYKGKVYDVTGWLPDHPGGSNAIARYCGTSDEFENAFTDQHGTSKSSMMMQVTKLKGDFSG